ncbi:hypothetical protein TL5118_01055 [Thalassovita autumnalis]|uniref:Uncharacterized protein n=1 Tax=Thalassovita autumnalis TaxID=2072972 RepID=A0A0N7LXF1_9RHOB|nr:hypothetical protein [Thalassovita autumnalis]CUH64887.1 hypothetical protein TL5118_01055 [Thalassovita autumnalis]CUH71727.1 hypothetical protein TL5120_01517 [Thalassovita autumnalis]
MPQSLGSTLSDEVWHLVREIKDALYVDQPYLGVSEQGGAVVVEGTYALLPHLLEHRDMGAFAQHKVRVTVEADYPKTEPVVVVLDRSIPRKDDYHCSANGECCITVFETWKASAKDISIAGYFNGPFRNFFLSQLLKRRKGHWPFDDWAHGEEGFAQAVAEFIGCRSDVVTVKNILSWRINNEGLPASEDAHCPCGSGEVTSGCCAALLSGLVHRLPQDDAQRWLERLTKKRRQMTPNEIQRRIHENRPFRRVQ